MLSATVLPATRLSATALAALWSSRLSATTRLLLESVVRLRAVVHEGTVATPIELTRLCDASVFKTAIAVRMAVIAMIPMLTLRVIPLAPVAAAVEDVAAIAGVVKVIVVAVTWITEPAVIIATIADRAIVTCIADTNSAVSPA